MEGTTAQTTTDSITPIGTTPYGSRPASTTGFSTPATAGAGRRYFHSRRIKPGESPPQPWQTRKDPREKWVTIIPCIGLFVGLAIAGVLVWQGVTSVVNHKYCPVLVEDWSGGFNEQVWQREVEVGGFGYDLLSPIRL
jgi:hypothetical protein